MSSSKNNQNSIKNLNNLKNNLKSKIEDENKNINFSNKENNFIKRNEERSSIYNPNQSSINNEIEEIKNKIPNEVEKPEIELKIKRNSINNRKSKSGDYSEDSLDNINLVESSRNNKNIDLVKYNKIFLEKENKSSIFYNHNDKNSTVYSNIDDLIDLNNINKNSTKHLVLKEGNPAEFYVKPRVSTKKNFNSFLNINNNENLQTQHSKTNTESNLNDNSSIYQEKKNKIFKNHSTSKNYLPDFKNYSIEKALNIFISDKKKYSPIKNIDNSLIKNSFDEKIDLGKSKNEINRKVNIFLIIKL